MSDRYRLICGDAIEKMKALPDASIDAIITDPPYPEIDRHYGRLTEEEWHTLMRGVVAECRRVLMPTGSAVFILQPNSEKIGRMRPWLWEFMAWTTREWNMVQDAYWWNTASPPNVHCQQIHGLMRGSVKPCVWLGPSNCYRDQSSVLWTETDANAAARRTARAGRVTYTSGHNFDALKATSLAVERGGVTPYNLLPVANTDSQSSGGASGHGASTPLDLAYWWTRYLTPHGGMVLDPFCGSGTMGIAALNWDCRFIGIEKDQSSVDIAHKRIGTVACQEKLPLFGDADA